MPELPEVETIRRGLESVVLRKRITDFESRDPKVVQVSKENIVGSQISSIDRRAKILILNLSNEKSLIIHLKMTGQLVWDPSGGENDFVLRKVKGPSISLRAATQRVAGGHPSSDLVAKLPNTHTRAIFHFDDNSVLFFNDLRRFGYIKIYDTRALKGERELKNIGPEPFDPVSGKASKNFSVEYLVKRADKIPNRNVKQFITDQEIIAGVGNIYVDEALFLAKVLPTRRVGEVSLLEWKKIRDSIITVLELGIKYGGSSEDTYVNAFGEQGTMNQHVNVYRKTGLPCPNGCGGKIERISLGGRGTHYCPNCQR